MLPSMLLERVGTCPLDCNDEPNGYRARYIVSNLCLRESPHGMITQSDGGETR